MYRLALAELVGEIEVCHVGTASRSVDGEEAESRAWDVVELGVGMRQKLVALLCGCIEADGVVDLVISAVGHLLVGAVDTGTAGVDEMCDAVLPVVVAVATGFEDVVEADEVAGDVGIGVGDAVTHPCLCCEVDHNVGLVRAEEIVYGGAVGEVATHEEKVGVLRECLKSFLFQAHVVVVVHVVDADNGGVWRGGEQPLSEVGTDEACGSRDQNGLTLKVYVWLFHIYKNGSRVSFRAGGCSERGCLTGRR